MLLRSSRSWLRSPKSHGSCSKTSHPDGYLYTALSGNLRIRARCCWSSTTISTPSTTATTPIRQRDPSRIPPSPRTKKPVVYYSTIITSGQRQRAPSPISSPSSNVTFIRKAYTRVCASVSSPSSTTNALGPSSSFLSASGGDRHILFSPSYTHSRPFLVPRSGGAMGAQNQIRSHSGHHGHHGHHHNHDTTYLTSSNKQDAAVRITRIGLYVNLAMAIGKGIGGYVFHSQGTYRT